MSDYALGASDLSWKEYLRQLDAQYGLPAGTLEGTYGVESGYGANIPKLGGAFSGPFQQSKAFYQEFGQPGGSRDKFQDAANAAGNYYSQAKPQFQSTMGYDPSGGDLYVGYNQGTGNRGMPANSPFLNIDKFSSVGNQSFARAGTNAPDFITAANAASPYFGSTADPGGNASYPGAAYGGGSPWDDTPLSWGF